MSVRVAINGFGRIGRMTFRAIKESGLLGNGIDVVAVNDIVPADTLAYLVKYDSLQGNLDSDVTSRKSDPSLEHDDIIVVDGYEIKALSLKVMPEELPWNEYGVGHCSGNLPDYSHKKKKHSDTTMLGPKE